MGNRFEKTKRRALGLASAGLAMLAVLNGCGVAEENTSKNAKNKQPARDSFEAICKTKSYVNNVGPLGNQDNGGYKKGNCLQEAIPIGQTGIILGGGGHGELGLVAIKLSFRGEAYDCVLPVRNPSDSHSDAEISIENFSINGSCLPAEPAKTR